MIPNNSTALSAALLVIAGLASITITTAPNASASPLPDVMSEGMSSITQGQKASSDPLEILEYIQREKRLRDIVEKQRVTMRNHKNHGLLGLLRRDEDGGFKFTRTVAEDRHPDGLVPELIHTVGLGGLLDPILTAGGTDQKVQDVFQQQAGKPLPRGNQSKFR
jgi:hypothetical protein